MEVFPVIDCSHTKMYLLVVHVARPKPRDWLFITTGGIIVSITTSSTHIRPATPQFSPARVNDHSPRCYSDPYTISSTAAMFACLFMVSVNRTIPLLCLCKDCEIEDNQSNITFDWF